MTDEICIEKYSYQPILKRLAFITTTQTQRNKQPTFFGGLLVLNLKT